MRANLNIQSLSYVLFQLPRKTQKNLEVHSYNLNIGGYVKVSVLAIKDEGLQAAFKLRHQSWRLALTIFTFIVVFVIRYNRNLTSDNHIRSERCM